MSEELVQVLREIRDELKKANENLEQIAGEIYEALGDDDDDEGCDCEHDCACGAEDKPAHDKPVEPQF